MDSESSCMICAVTAMRLLVPPQREEARDEWMWPHDSGCCSILFNQKRQKPGRPSIKWLTLVSKIFPHYHNCCSHVKAIKSSTLGLENTHQNMCHGMWGFVCVNLHAWLNILKVRQSRIEMHWWSGWSTRLFSPIRLLYIHRIINAATKPRPNPTLKLVSTHIASLGEP